MLAYFRHKPYSFRSSVAVYTHMSDKSNTSAMMEPKLTQKAILRALDFAYEKALEGRRVSTRRGISPATTRARRAAL